MSLKSMILKGILLVSALPAMAAVPALLDVSYRPLAGKTPVNLNQQQGGKVLLIVNTASKCGFTPQYEGMEALQQQFAAQGFAVLGFPSNDFRGRSPAARRRSRSSAR